MTWQQSQTTQHMYDSQRRSEAARNNRRAGDAAESTQERISHLVGAMETQLDLARASQDQAERSEKFARRMSWWSLGVAIASLAAAIAAVIVSVVALS